MPIPRLNANRAADPIFHERLIDDYAWRFELIRSTLEDLDQLIEDAKPVPATSACSPPWPTGRAFPYRR